MPVYGMKQFESSKMLFMQNLNDDIKNQNIELYTLYEMYPRLSTTGGRAQERRHSGGEMVLQDGGLLPPKNELMELS